MRRDREKKIKIMIMIVTIVLIIILFISLLFTFFEKKENELEEVITEELIEESLEELNEEIEEYAEDTEDVLESETVIWDEEEDLPSSKDESTEGAVVDEAAIAIALGENEITGTSIGIDVAKWQGSIDWQAVASSGIEFAMIRVGYRTIETGVITEDPTAQYNLQEASNAGIPIGVYFFSTATTAEEAIEEAAWVADFIAKYPITYPVAYNCEGFTATSSRQYGMTNEERTAMATIFLDAIESSGYTPMFYASKNEMEENTYWDMTSLEAKYKVWVSQYPTEPYPTTSSSSYTGTYDMWQYTDQGSISGISTGTDVNVAYFQYTEIAEPKDSTAPEVVSENIEALFHFQEVEETVTSKDESNLRSTPSTTEDNIVTVLKNGDTATRTAVCADSGWSRVVYNGEILYAVSSFLTTDLSYVTPVETVTDQVVVDGVIITTQFADVNENVTAKEVTNLRNIPSVDNAAARVVGELKNGDVIVRTGISDNGWSRLLYNDQVVYAVSSYLNVV
ncbi:MAG: GH25 family lysozyme [Eubacteriales bacterium]